MNKLSRFPNFSRCRPAFWFYNAQPGISDSFKLQTLLCHMLKVFKSFGALHLLRSENHRGHSRNIRTLFLVFYVILCLFVQSLYHKLFALCGTPFMAYINSCVFWHRGSFLRESLQQRYI